jgi:MAP/microtubule affinity-regulating kinase
MDMYVIGKALGQGATAEVKMAKHRVLDLNVAIKIYDRKKMSS